MHAALFCLTLSAAMVMPGAIADRNDGSVPHGWTVRASSSASSEEAGWHAVDGKSSTHWTAADGTESGWLRIDFGRSMTIDRMIIWETAGRRVVDRFCLQIKTDDGWEAVEWGGIIGNGREFRFNPVKARRIRLVICEASAPPSISEFVVFHAAAD